MTYTKIDGYHQHSKNQLNRIYDNNIITHDQISKILNCISQIPKRNSPEFVIKIKENDPIKITLKNHPVFSFLEISLEMKGKVDNEKPVKYDKYSILLKFYSDKGNFCYREKLDSLEIKEKFSNTGSKRLITQYHFDMKKKGTDAPEPFFHLHFGADNAPDDMCWFPKEIKDPRFPYPPMDIMLLIEFILQNYFQKESERLRNTPEWKQMIKKSQEIFQRHYFEKCMDFLDRGSTLLECSCKYPK